MSHEVKISDEKTKVLSAVLIRGDLASLSEDEKLSHLRAVCDSLGLNPLTNPFKYISMNGKLVLYAGKDATDQLRKLHNVSLEITSRERVDDCFLVTARARMPGDRIDESVGAVYLGKLSGDALANAYMKAESKAKRRVTLSICGLGMLDELELETIPDINHPPKKGDMAFPQQVASKSQEVIQKAREALYKAADAHKVSNEMVKTILQDRYGKDSSMKLNLSELEDLEKFIKGTNEKR